MAAVTRVFWRMDLFALNFLASSQIVQRYAVMVYLQGQSLATTVTRTQMMDARAPARLSVDTIAEVRVPAVAVQHVVMGYGQGLRLVMIQT